MPSIDRIRYSPISGSQACDSSQLDNSIETALGVDPGGRWTGIVARQGEHLLHAEVVTKDDDRIERWCRTVRDRVRELREQYPVDVLAVEGLTTPNPHMGRGTNVIKAYGETYAVIGALSDLLDLLVRPKKAGKRPPAEYPDALWSAREDPRNGGKGTGVLRHVRSAWDIAGTAYDHHR